LGAPKKYGEKTCLTWPPQVIWNNISSSTLKNRREEDETSLLNPALHCTKKPENGECWSPYTFVQFQLLLLHPSNPHIEPTNPGQNLILPIPATHNKKSGFKQNGPLSIHLRLYHGAHPPNH